MTDYADIRYRSHDGLQLVARDYPCLEGEPETTVLCIPGLTRNSADFHDIARYLQTQGQSQRQPLHCRVVAVDLRGRGRSDYDPNPDNYHPTTYVRDIQTLIDNLELNRVVLQGTSLGGLISLLLGAFHPTWLQALIINDFGPELEQAGLERIKSYVGKPSSVTTWEEAVAQSRDILGSELPDLSDEQWLSLCQNIYREDPRGRPVLAYDPAIAKPFKSDRGEVDPAPLWTAFDALPPVPILLIRGALSDLLSRHCVKEMQDRHPDLNSVEIPNRGHAPLLNEPESVAAIIDFLHSLPGRRT